MVAIHITGASGSGTTTLGRALAANLGLCHLDTDDVYWEPTDPPYNAKRPVVDRLKLIEAVCASSPDWVLSGSLCGWGDPLRDRFDLVVFLSAPTEVRLRRLRAREADRFGAAALAPGGAMHAHHAEFLAWASEYEQGKASRNRAEHERWLAALPCPVLRLDGEIPTADQVEAVGHALEGRQRRPGGSP